MRKTRKPNKPPLFYEVTCCEGLERFVQRELRRSFGERHKLNSARAKGEILLSATAPLPEIVELKTAQEAFRVLPFEVTRPRGLLEPLKLREIVTAISLIIKNGKGVRMQSFRVGAAGADSKDLKRFRETISAETKLREDEESGELLIRLRRSKIHREGWDVLLRLTGKPLHVRNWRKSDYRGALDPTIARAMVELLSAKANYVVIDPMCGSGTLLIEQIEMLKPAAAIGVEIEKSALTAAKSNTTGVRGAGAITFIRGNGCMLPFADNSADAMLVNPPWGEAIKSKVKIEELYSTLVKESARILKKRGRLCIIVQRSDDLQRALETVGGFALIESLSVLQRKGFHPTIFLAEKK